MKHPMPLSELLAETFKTSPTPGNLTAWADALVSRQETLFALPLENTDTVK